MRRMKEETGVKNLGSWKADGQVEIYRGLLSCYWERFPARFTQQDHQQPQELAPSSTSGSKWRKGLSNESKNKGYRMKAFAQRQLELQILASLFLMERQLSISFHDQARRKGGIFAPRWRVRGTAEGGGQYWTQGRREPLHAQCWDCLAVFSQLLPISCIWIHILWVSYSKLLFVGEMSSPGRKIHRVQKFTPTYFGQKTPEGCRHQAKWGVN